MYLLKDLNVYYGAIRPKVSTLGSRRGNCYLIGSNGAENPPPSRHLRSPRRNQERSTTGQDLLRISAPEIVSWGSPNPQREGGVFSNMSVLENLELGAYTRKDGEQLRKDFDFVFTLFPRLSERKEQLAGTLSGG